MNNQCLSNLIKGPAYFQSANGSMIDLFLTTIKHLFQKQKANSFEVGISDHDHLIATMLKLTYENLTRITSLIKKEIMANKSGKKEDLEAYKKILVLKLIRKAKKNFLKSCIFTNDKMKNKIFRKFCKPFFTEKSSQYDKNVTLIKKKTLNI